jgi:hypothetical protein
MSKSAPTATESRQQTIGFSCSSTIWIYLSFDGPEFEPEYEEVGS